MDCFHHLNSLKQVEMPKQERTALNFPKSPFWLSHKFRDIFHLPRDDIWHLTRAILKHIHTSNIWIVSCLVGRFACKNGSKAIVSFILFKGIIFPELLVVQECCTGQLSSTALSQSPTALWLPEYVVGGHSPIRISSEVDVLCMKPEWATWQGPMGRLDLLFWRGFSTVGLT